MATFDPAPAEVHELIREYYPDLIEADARIGAVFAHPTLDGDHAATRDRAFAQEVPGLTTQAVEEIDADHEAAGMPAPSPDATRRRKPRGAAAVAANR